MKAMVYTQYGLPDVLQLKEVDKPVPGDYEVLIKVHAVSVNASDWEFLTGKPLYVRIWGLRKPRNLILGTDIAGQIEAVGKRVKWFRPGDKVFGDILGRGGGFAEYVCAPESKLTLKPESMTFEQAAAIPQSALVALQGLRKGNIQSGASHTPQKLLINGAGGGSGTYAVQLAKLFGAEVTAVDNTEKLDTMRSLGADYVIDYTRKDFTQDGRKYDMILDFAAHRSIFDCRRILNPGGSYVLVGGDIARILQFLFLGPLISMFGARKMGILAAKENRGMDYMIELFESGKILPVIDKRYPLSEVPEALRYLGDGHAKGKVVITFE